MNERETKPRLYPDFTLDELLSELIELGQRPKYYAEQIEMVKAEIKKRFHLIEANRNRL